MTSMWVSLFPLILVNALLPMETVVTIMLLGTPSRVRTAGAAVAGEIVVRLLQGLTFGMILHWGTRPGSGHDQGSIESTILLVVSILFLTVAVRELLDDDDPDAPPPKWMTMLSSMSPARAFLVGAGMVLVSVKLWVFTLAAMGIIGAAGQGRPTNVLIYVIYVLLAISTHVAVVGAAAIFPQRSKAFLDRTLHWLQDHTRQIMIVLGLVFGLWFLYKALLGFGIL